MTIASAVLLFGVVPEIVAVAGKCSRGVWYDWVWHYFWGHSLGHHRPFSHHKNIFVWHGDGDFVFNLIRAEGEVTSSVLEYSYPTGGPGGKPNKYTKNVDLFEFLIRSYTDVGDIVLDPFVGGGTTLIAAECAGRLCYGIDIEPKYVAATLERASMAGLVPVRKERVVS